MKKITFYFLLFVLSFNLSAQEISIIPQPFALIQHAEQSPYLINEKSKITINSNLLKPSVNFLNDYLQKYFQFQLKTAYVSEKANTINLILDSTLANKKGTYKMEIDFKGISVTGKDPEAIFYAIQSIIQLLPTKKGVIAIPPLSITDYPRFEYRGMHLDVSRHFFDVAFVKKYIDYLALHKMNYFHWHLTDDHGWRIEIKKYPKLTSVGAWRNGSIIGLWPGKGNEGIKYQVLPNEVKITPKDAVIKTDGIKYGGYYTQEEIKEVIAYAAKRYITVIPEIEMPAHSMAALAAYPEFGTEPNKKYEVAQTWGMMNKYNNVFAPTEKTFKFLEDVLTEVMGLFPSQYIHIGGDEASKIWWKNSPSTQQMMKANNLKDESALQSYFIHRIEKFVNSHGKTIIGWDEILDGGLAPNAVVMSWRGEKGGIAAAKVRQKVIMTPEEKLYLNHKQFMKEDSLAASRFLPLETVYNYEPIPTELRADEAQYIWGAQGNLWSEYIANSAKVEYMLFPRLDALSELLWSAKSNKSYPDFLKRLKMQLKRYDLMGITYSKRYLEN
ncbi:beta-N-acetylhexosaminidase [Pedobacter sp. Du54]|uniref:beta-N-acetylhexosaminidase n=1 Tax=Pedobacter anseongensis TaxID=3133439 RepID=UPI00309E61A9